MKAIAKFLSNVVGSPVSVKSVTDYLISNGRKVSPNTVDNYIEALCESFIFYEVDRFDIMGKELLKTNKKYYIVDLGLRNFVLPKRKYDLGFSIENIVYFELLRREFRVNIGKFGENEVDFVARKNDEIKYFQVTADMTAESTFNRDEVFTYVYGILANSNAVPTDITYYDEKLMQRSYNQMDNNEVVAEEVAAVVENNTGIEIEPLFEEQVDFDTFSKSDFRVVKVKNCEAVPKSKKLLRFTLDDGTENERTILSGVHAFYEPEELVGKTLLAIVNLPPRSMMGIDSCGMLLSAIHNVNGEEKLNLVMLDDAIPAGAKLY